MTLQRHLVLLLATLAACNSFGPDNDGDGWPEDLDCDDANATVNPIAIEACDGIDNDCDGVADPDVACDADGDGYTADLDCDDDNADIAPGAPELCDGLDNDCDGDVDDDDSAVAASDATVWFGDSDGDGYGVTEVVAVSCAQPAGYAGQADDCDDDVGSTNPGASEVCADGVDNDCDLTYDCNDDSCTGDAACAPVITNIEPASSPYNFDTAVTITGSGFDWDTAGVTSVTFGGVAATGVTVVNDHTVRATAPTWTGPATVTVELTNDNGTATTSYDYVSCIYVAVGKQGRDGSLYCVNPATGDVSEIGELGVAFTGLAFAPDGTLYGTESTQRSESALFTIDPTTGATTEIGTLTDSGGSSVHASISDLAFVGSRLIGWSETYISGSYDDPVEIDTATATVTRIASVTSPSSTYNTGLAADADGNIYLLNYGLYGSIYSIDASSGAATQGSSLDGNYTNGQSGGATFHDGELYALDCNYSGDCSLTIVDLSTGALTPTTWSLPGLLDAIASPTP